MAAAAASSEDNDNSKSEDVLESFKIPPPLLPSNPKTMSSLSSSLSRSLEVEAAGKTTGTKNTSGGKGIGKTTSKTGSGTLNSNVLLGLNGKPLPQIPINVFWNFVEAHFRPLDSTDFDEILRRGNVYSGINSDQLYLLNIRPFIMPKLGRGWREVWRERYGFDAKHSNSLSSKGAALQVHVSSQENQSSLLKIRERLGRLLTGSDSGLDGGLDGGLDSGLDGGSIPETATETTEITNNHLPTHLERRIIAELPVPSRLVKIRGMDLMEDDEISEDLHSLQQRLKEIHYINRWRLQRLIADADSSFKKRMRPQEFYLLLDELDKQIEHSYLKVIKQCSSASASVGGGGEGISSKKRKYSSTTSSLNPSDDDDDVSSAGGEPRLEDEYPLIAARRKLLATFTGMHCSDPIPSRSAFMSGIPKEEIESIFDVDKEAFLMREAKISSSVVPLSCSPSSFSSACFSYSTTDSDSNHNTTVKKVAAPLSLASFPSLLPHNK